MSTNATPEKTYKKRPASDRPKMPPEQRAKQFAPFDALSGLSERLRQAEEEHERARGMTDVRYAGDAEEGEES